MKIDFHVPTAPLTRRSLHTPDQAFRAARECGLDGIAVVETNVLRHAFGFTSLHDVARVRYGLTIFQGLYLHTTLGPLLVYGQRLLKDAVRIDSQPDTIAAIDYCLEQGWAVVLAHPFRHGVGPEAGVCSRFKMDGSPVERAVAELGYVIRKMHAVEISGSATKEDNALAEGLAKALNLPLLVGSGACYHTQLRAGCWTKVPGTLRSNEQVAAYLVEAAKKGFENGVFRPADLRGIYSTGGRRSEP